MLAYDRPPGLAVRRRAAPRRPPEVRPLSHTWSRLLVEQLDFYWQAHLWPRLTGLTDSEYAWEPAPRSASVRRGPDGTHALEEAPPGGVPTIAWRLAHIGAHNLATRAATFFGENPSGADMFDPRHVPVLPGGAAGALDLLESSFRRWQGGVAGLDDARLAAPVGPLGGPYADEPMAALVLHVARETMHHGGEICLLRDLYAAR
ncbi:DinB family protein [Plantactinospora siamensis]|uniref:DinB family protein n=1 Tax=Plantactinospora siamensis TaxID=555372 RepID=A0ABV6P2I7_9ACTN